MFEVHFPTRSPRVLEPVIGTAAVDTLFAIGERMKPQMEGRRTVHINSTAAGGGVAEMLPALLAYTTGLGIDGRWFVIEGDPEFFAITKRLHHRLHGEPGDFGPLGHAEQQTFIATVMDNQADASGSCNPATSSLCTIPSPRRWPTG